MRPLFPVGVMLVLLSGMEQTALASVKSEWKALPPSIYKCMKKMVEAVEKAPLSKVIAAGISPNNPAYAPGMDTCKKFAAGPRKNFECTIQDPNGNNVDTICNESYAIASGSSVTKLSADEALDRIVSGQQVQFYLEETPEGHKRRQSRLINDNELRLQNGTYTASDLTGPCLDLYNNWRDKTGDGAFAVSASGSCGALNGASNQRVADDGAIEACRQKSDGRQCFVIERNTRTQVQLQAEAPKQSGLEEDEVVTPIQGDSSQGTIHCDSDLCKRCAESCGEKSIEICTKAIEEDPKNLVNYFNRGTAWNNKKEFGNAVDDFTKAIQLVPTDAESYSARAIAWKQQGDIDKAIADASRALELDPKLEVARDNLSYYRRLKNGSVKNWKYIATLSCGMGGLSNMNILACFSRGSTGVDTELSITRDGVQKLLKNYMLVNIPTASGSVMLNASSDIPDGMIIDDDGLRILLPEHFRIVAQNSQDKLVLGIKIENFGGQRSECTAQGERIVNDLPEIIYQQEVGRYGVIDIGQ